MKIFVTDLDGTLLNDKKEISNENKSALERLSKKNVQIVLASGRSVHSIKNIAKELNISKSIIALNGAVVLNDQFKVVTSRPINDEMMEFLVNHLDFMNWTIYFSTLNVEYVLNPSFAISEYQKEMKSKQDIIRLIYQEKILKVSIYYPDDEVIATIKQKIQHPKISIFHSDRYFIEIVAEGVSKKAGLLEIVNLLDSNVEKIYAIGDQENDIELIKYADFSFGMANAVEKIKEIATIIVSDNNNNGVEQAVNYLIETE